MATLSDIAQETGLSLSTVSHVLNDRPGFSEKTRKRVREAARRLNYRPNLLARGLQGSRGTKMVGLIWSLGRAESQFIIRRLGQQLWQQGYAMQTLECMSHNTLVLEALRDFNRRGVEAVVVQHYQGMLQDEAIVEELKKPRSVVLVNNTITDGLAPEGSWDVIVQDAAPPIAQVLDGWARQGRRRPALAGSMSHLTKYLEPIRTFRQKIAEHGWPDQDYIIDKGVAGQAGRYVEFYLETLERLYGDRPFPYDAVLCVGDDGAAAVHYWLSERGVQVGSEVAVVGYGDMEWTVTLRPPLASINPQGDLLSQTIVQTVFRRLGDPSLPPLRQRLQASYQWRPTAGPQA